jgi:small-conductance mechanosensitive channel
VAATRASGRSVDRKAGSRQHRPGFRLLGNGAMDINEYLQSVGRWALTSGLQILLIVVIAAVALRAVSLLSSRLIALISRRSEDVEFQKRTDTLKSVINYLLSTVVFAVAVMMILGELGIEIGPVLAAAGVVGVAIGFGAQTLVQDVISGFFILLEDQIRVGDVVEIAGKGGLVEKVNLRMTILRDLAGNVHYIRNGHIDTVTNMTKEYSRYVFNIGVAYREDVDEVMDVLRQLDEELRQDPEFKDDILQPIEILGLDQFADSAVVIKARTTTKPIQQWRVGREFNRRLKKRFDELGIEIPFPHVTMYMGQDKKGSSPPLNVELSGPDAGRGIAVSADGEAS